MEHCEIKLDNPLEAVKTSIETALTKCRYRRGKNYTCNGEVIHNAQLQS